MPNCFLQEWVCGSAPGFDSGLISREQIRSYQLSAVRRTIAYLTRNSPFYRDLLAPSAGVLPGSLSELADYPLTGPDDIRRDPLAFLCVSQDRVDRVVTLQTSGTTHQPKRLYFTRSELEHTVTFFHHCFRHLTRPGQRVLVLMPGDKSGSVADLIGQALQKTGVEYWIGGLVRNYPETLRTIRENGVNFIIGLPSQVLALSRWNSAPGIPPGQIESVILSADYVPQSLAESLSQTWQCRTYAHYGMTEMGYGGGIECRPASGYHLRDLDFYFEIIDPVSGRPVAEGEWGELVFTTLRRTAMPLLRYRTGDLAVFLPSRCECGSSLTRIGRVRGRLRDKLCLKGCGPISMPVLDEAVFALKGVINYQAAVEDRRGRDVLQIRIQAPETYSYSLEPAVFNAVTALPQLKAGLEAGTVRVEIIGTTRSLPDDHYIQKRQINDLRRPSLPEIIPTRG